MTDLARREEESGSALIAYAGRETLEDAPKFRGT